MIVQTHAELVPLLRKTVFVDYVTVWPDDPCDPAQQWDQQIEVMELPRAFGTTLATIPCDVPYRFAPHSRSRVVPWSGLKPRIGVSGGTITKWSAKWKATAGCHSIISALH